ncbi:MAG: glycosyltransferase family 1 protein, partial [Oscillochloris sp.]|nr:glycosyltransferase family 1 protein [Oscillochloris sp.]
MNTETLVHPIRVAMLARVVYPLHGFGGIERHVGHLVIHLARLGVTGTLYVQPTPDGHQPTPAELPALTQGQWSLACLRYDYTSPLLPPNGILGRQINY